MRACVQRRPADVRQSAGTRRRGVVSPPGRPRPSLRLPYGTCRLAATADRPPLGRVALERVGQGGGEQAPWASDEGPWHTSCRVDITCLVQSSASPRPRRSPPPRTHRPLVGPCRTNQIQSGHTAARHLRRATFRGTGARSIRPAAWGRDREGDRRGAEAVGVVPYGTRRGATPVPRGNGSADARAAGPVRRASPSAPLAPSRDGSRRGAQASSGRRRRGRRAASRSGRGSARAETTTLARQGDEQFVATALAAEAGEAVLQQPAAQVPIDLVEDVARERRSCVACFLQEILPVLPDEPPEQGHIGATSPAVARWERGRTRVAAPRCDTPSVRSNGGSAAQSWERCPARCGSLGAPTRQHAVRRCRSCGLRALAGQRGLERRVAGSVMDCRQPSAGPFPRASTSHVRPAPRPPSMHKCARAPALPSDPVARLGCTIVQRWDPALPRAPRVSSRVQLQCSDGRARSGTHA
jgi:hypothetical protein